MMGPMTTPGVLLLGADYYGTLAAVRAYGRQGISVAVADAHRHGRASASRYVTSRLVSPPVSEPQALIDWLVRWGQAHPGTLLYPTNDHLAWLFAAHREQLSASFVMYSPSEKAVMMLLDKTRLQQACADVGIETPVTFALDDIEAHAAAAGRLCYPAILKPRTQVLLDSGVKGIPVGDSTALAHALARYRALVRFNPALTDRYPDMAEPMVQEYLAAAETNIISVSGFVGEDGDIVARAALKVLQRPRKMGIGLCFEGREVEPALLARLAALCRKVGYHGTFEAEFIADGDRRLLIDFNPRYYSQMAFDVARGMDLPMLVWHAARGDRHALDEERGRARAWVPAGGEIYAHQRMLDMILALQGLSGRMSSSEVRHWRGWYRDQRVTATDAVHDRDDPTPAIVDAALWVGAFARHPRSFIRNFVMNDAGRSAAPARPAVLRGWARGLRRLVSRAVEVLSSGRRGPAIPSTVPVRPGGSRRV